MAEGLRGCTNAGERKPAEGVRRLRGVDGCEISMAHAGLGDYSAHTGSGLGRLERAYGLGLLRDVCVE